MPQPVKLSDDLILDARVTAEASERSIAGQIEFWAGLGRAIEGILRTDTLLALRRSGRVRPLSEALDAVDSLEGRERVARVMAARPFPRFEPDADTPGVLIRIDEDGTRTRGRFVRREFKPVQE